jgi:hypothetical protein
MFGVAIPRNKDEVIELSGRLEITLLICELKVDRGSNTCLVII